MTAPAHAVREHRDGIACPCLVAGYASTCQHGGRIYETQHGPYVARVRKDEDGHP